MGWFEMMAMAGPAFFMVLPGLALPFLYIYLVHDYAGRRQGDRDPALGSKVFTTLVMTLAGQLALAGLAIAAAAIAADGPSEGPVKTGIGLGLAGLIVGAFPTFLYVTRVRGQGAARVGHQALGLNALFAGMAFAGAVVISCQALVHGEKLGQPVAVAVVYGAAMVALGLRLQQSPIPAARAQREP
jgi:hypothetical protein